ncbi:hypothetical protein BLGI_547 [Brevibacillus laterosporus GI-9]|nr:hypothetical protein BLGI_547 [Brevibacillus laterosporus GI-9]
MITATMIRLRKVATTPRQEGYREFRFIISSLLYLIVIQYRVQRLAAFVNTQVDISK